MKRLLKIIGIVFAVLIVLGVIGNLIGGDDDTSTSTASTETAKVVAEATTEISAEEAGDSAKSESSVTNIDDSSSNDISMDSSTAAVDTTLPAKDETENDVEEWTDEEKFEFYMAYAEVVLNQNYDGNYTINHENNMITVNIWRDGIAEGAILAKNGNRELLSSWDTMVDNTAGMAKSLYDQLETVNATDKNVTVNILNDKNKDNVLVTYLNGVVIYDAVHEQ